jgi:hypothetical protein
MTNPLDVLVLESHPHAATMAVADLEAAGHRVHRCHRPGDRGFPCVGVTDPTACPIANGVDVALVVRRRVSPRPTPLEGGVSCAIRAGVPVVEEGPDTLDPFAPWLAGRSHGNVVEACERAVGVAYAPLREAILARLVPLVTAVGVDLAAIECRIAPDGPRLQVELSGPEVGRALEHAFGVRVLDAVRSFGRTFGEVNVTYQAHEAAPTT